MNWGRLLVENHRGVPVPRVLGVALAIDAVIWTIAYGIVAETGTAGWGSLAGLLLAFGAGLADDLAPAGPRGIRNHMRSVASGRPTTGLLWAETPSNPLMQVVDLAWLAGAWVGTRGEGNATSIEERWSPPAGGAMLAVARSVRAEKMRTFEFLRIVEHEGGLVYKAQPGGAPPTEFTLTELTKTDQGATRAVFDNPRHDYPKRIVYEISAEGGLSASIGFTKGGSPRRFEFQREGS